LLVCLPEHLPRGFSILNLNSRFKYHGEIFNTCPATGAAVFDDSAGTFFDFDLEIAGSALDALNVCVGDQFDI